MNYLTTIRGYIVLIGWAMRVVRLGDFYRSFADIIETTVQYFDTQ